MLTENHSRTPIAERPNTSDELDNIALRLQNSDECEVISAVAELVGAARMLRDESESNVWKTEIIPTLRCHPVATLIYQDPFTDHAKRKPRGYPGDALLLDYIYRYPTILPYIAAATNCGRNIFRYTGDGCAPRAVRNRRELIAKEIDMTATLRRRARILSLACGHLREVDLSIALQTGIVELKALDHDHLTVVHIQQEYAALPITAEVGSIKSLLRSTQEIGRYDFVYAAGLYDYLDDRVASVLLEKLLTLCAPGGKVWVANFLPDIPDAGYMEAFMDWFLIYRSTDAMINLLQGVPQGLISASRVFLEHEGNIAFLEVVRS